MFDRYRRLTDDTRGEVSFPVAFERVRRGQLSPGDRILLRAGEQVPVDGTILAVLDLPDDDPPAAACPVETQDGGLDRRAIDDEVDREEVVRERSVVVEVEEWGLLPWWWYAALAGLTLRSLWDGGVRFALVAGVLVLALAGTGLGDLNPVERALQGSGVGDSLDERPPDSGAESPDPPSEIPSVTVSPPDEPPPGTPTARTVPPPAAETPATGTPTRAETTASPPTGTSETPEEGSDVPGTGSTPSSGEPTGTPTDEASLTPTATPTSTATGTPRTVDAAITVTADDPPAYRNVDGKVGEVSGTVGGSLTWTTDRVDSVVLVALVWIPEHGWTEVRRVELAPDSPSVSIASPMDLGAVFGEGTLYANESWSTAFENPDPDTTKVTPGRAAVTAVLFDGDTEVARVTDADGFNVSVRNVDFDLELGSDPGGADANTSLLSAGGVVPGDRWINRGNLTNDGTVPGEVKLSSLELVSYENGQTDPEADVDETGGDPGRGAGELQDALEVRIAVVDENGSRRYVFGDGDAYRPIKRLRDESVTIAELDPDETATIVIEYRVLPGAGNEIQSDSVVADFGFTMIELS